MAKWVHADVLDNGLNEIKTNCDKMLLIKAYTAADSYATVDSNECASVAMVSGDFTLTTGSSSERILTIPDDKQDLSASANSGASPNLHIAFVDSVNSKVLWVTDETSDQVITAGNIIFFPAVSLITNQPV
jgi:hypothetical protein